MAGGATCGRMKPEPLLDPPAEAVAGVICGVTGWMTTGRASAASANTPKPNVNANVIAAVLISLPIARLR